jgi:hypothetical protein
MAAVTTWGRYTCRRRTSRLASWAVGASRDVGSNIAGSCRAGGRKNSGTIISRRIDILGFTRKVTVKAYGVRG